MAFPSIAAVNSGVTAAASSQTINLPTGITAGDRLVVFLVATTIQTYTWPAGWTELWDAGNPGCSGAERIADGSEGASITVTASSVFASTYASLRITGAHASTAAAVGTLSSATTTNPNPPSVTPSWGAEDTLWIALAGNGSSAATNLTAYPANYSLNQQAIDTGSGALLGYAARELNAASEDPGTFTFSSGGATVAQTIAIRPAPSAAPFVNEDTAGGYRRSLPRQDHTKSLSLPLYGKDQFFGAPGEGPRYDYPNPRAPQRAISLRTHTDTLKLNLLGKDQIYGAPGQVPDYDWPLPRVAPRSISLRTHVNTFIPPATAAPFEPILWTNPAVAARSAELRTWLRGPMPPDQVQAPFTPLDWVVPKRARPAQPTWSQVNLLEGVLARPFLPSAWPQPGQARPAPQFSPVNLLGTLLAPSAFPFRAQEWRVPGPQRRGDQSWTVNLLLTTLAPPAPPTAGFDIGRGRVSSSSASGRIADSAAHGGISILAPTGRASTSAPSGRARTSKPTGRPRVT